MYGLIWSCLMFGFWNFSHFLTQISPYIIWSLYILHAYQNLWFHCLMNSFSYTTIQYFRVNQCTLKNQTILFFILHRTTHGALQEIWAEWMWICAFLKVIIVIWKRTFHLSKLLPSDCPFSCPEHFSGRDSLCKAFWHTGSGDGHQDTSFTIKCVHDWSLSTLEIQILTASILNSVFHTIML